MPSRSFPSWVSRDTSCQLSFGSRQVPFLAARPLSVADLPCASSLFPYLGRAPLSFLCLSLFPLLASQAYLFNAAVKLFCLMLMHKCNSYRGHNAQQARKEEIRIASIKEKETHWLRKAINSLHYKAKEQRGLLGFEGLLGVLVRSCQRPPARAVQVFSCCQWRTKW
eukprot:1150999-Pelagomonas_calceolata.AAC.1